MSLFQKIHLQIGPDERNALYVYMKEKQNDRQTISVIDFLKDIGLPNQTLGRKDRKRPPAKLLTDAELLES